MDRYKAISINDTLIVEITSDKKAHCTDGTLIAAGDNWAGQCDVGDWKLY